MPRGVGYPAKSGSLLLKDTQKRMETPHMSYSEVTRYLKSHLPAKIQWDGTTGGFREYKIAVEGFYTQMQLTICLTRSFSKSMLSVDRPEPLIIPCYQNTSRSPDHS